MNGFVFFLAACNALDYTIVIITQFLVKTLVPVLDHHQSSIEAEKELKANHFAEIGTIQEVVTEKIP